MVPVSVTSAPVAMIKNCSLCGRMSLKLVHVAVNQAVMGEPTPAVEWRRDAVVVEASDLIPVTVSHVVSPDEIYVQLASSDSRKTLKRSGSITLHCKQVECPVVY